MKKIFQILCITFLLIITPTIAHASCNILVDGTMLVCYDSQGNVIEPFVENGTTYVPVRAIAEAFDTTVNWDQDTLTVFLGEKSGTPTLGEHINIYYEGNAYICYDASGNTVYPILKDGATYLPIRGIGELFGKTVSWDNIKKTAILTTPATEDAIVYLSNSVVNTEATQNLTQELSFTGQLYFNNNIVTEISEKEITNYSPSMFSLSAILPENYTDTVSYLGKGSYFIYTDSSQFISSPFIKKAMINSQSQTTFSSLYIYLTTQGGYVKSISLNASADLSFNGLIFDEDFAIFSDIVYPEKFSFPKIPYPKANTDEKEDSVFTKDAEDAKLIDEFVESYMASAVELSPKKLLEMLHNDDYLRLYYKKSSNQQTVITDTIKKNLKSLYQYADGEYEISSMVYVSEPEKYKNSPDRVAKIQLDIKCSNEGEIWTEQVEITVAKVYDKWYLDSSVIEALM